MAKAKSKPASAPPAEAPDQPYYLQKAHVKDYRSVRDAEVELKPGLNIIIGPNGAGKTNFLRAVVNGVRLQEENEAGIGSSFLLAGSVPVTVDYVRNANPPQKTGTWVRMDNYNKFKISINAAGQVTVVDSIGEAWDQVLALREGPYPLGYDLELLPHGLPASEDIPVIDEEPILSYNSRRNNIVDGPRYLGPILWGIQSAFSRRNKQSGKEEKEQLADVIKRVTATYLVRLNAYLQRYTPVSEAQLSEQLKVYYNDINDDFPIKGYYLEYKSNGSWRRFDELSDGTKRLVYLVCQLTAPAFYIFGNDDFEVIERNNIFLLEEPELGIHPHQLYKLLDLIREVSKKHQVILTTHSPQVLDILRADELDRILICELKDPKKGTQFRRLTKKEQKEAHDYVSKVGFLSDYWLHSDLETE